MPSSDTAAPPAAPGRAGAGATREGRRRGPALVPAPPRSGWPRLDPDSVSRLLGLPCARSSTQSQRQGLAEELRRGPDLVRRRGAGPGSGGRRSAPTARRRRGARPTSTRRRPCCAGTRRCTGETLRSVAWLRSSGRPVSGLVGRHQRRPGRSRRRRSAGASSAAVQRPRLGRDVGGRVVQAEEGVEVRAPSPRRRPRRSSRRRSGRPSPGRSRSAGASPRRRPGTAPRASVARWIRPTAARVSW